MVFVESIGSPDSLSHNRTALLLMDFQNDIVTKSVKDWGLPKRVRDKIQERGKQLNGVTKAVERGKEQMEELSEEVEKLKEKVTED